MDKKRDIIMGAVKLQKKFLVKNSPIIENRRYLTAVDDVSFGVYEGEIFGLVGESGCGKSTLGRMMIRLHDITSGDLWYKTNNIGYCTEKQMVPYRKNLQMIFQDPFASLNPRMTIMDTVKEPLDVHKIGTPAEREEKVVELLKYVGLGENHINKFPHEMSGGQRQRVAIARAVILDPEFVVCDEPVSALDVSVRAQVLNLMRDLKEKKNLSYLFISHDLSVVKFLCDRIAVMYLGKIVEIATKDELFDNPKHPYTKALMSAIPIPDVNVKMNKIILSGDVPSPLNPPKGCRFNTRCPYATERCRTEEPELKKDANGHRVACHMAHDTFITK